MKMLITGASRGLGLSLTQEALRRGHEVIAAYRTQSPALASLCGTYPPERLQALPLDVASLQSVQEAARRVQAAWGTLDVIVNNAAVLLESKYFQGDPVTETPLSDFETTLDVNVMGAIRVTHCFAPLLYQSKAPWILNITSEGAALKPIGSHYMAYSVSKYALNMYTQKIRNYYKERRGDWPVKVYMVHPGRMHTDMGVENAQIQPEVPARGLMDILEGILPAPDADIPFIDFLGNLMPDHYVVEV